MAALRVARCAFSIWRGPTAHDCLARTPGSVSCGARRLPSLADRRRKCFRKRALCRDCRVSYSVHCAPRRPTHSCISCLLPPFIWDGSPRCENAPRRFDGPVDRRTFLYHWPSYSFTIIFKVGQQHARSQIYFNRIKDDKEIIFARNYLHNTLISPYSSTAGHRLLLTRHWARWSAPLELPPKLSNRLWSRTVYS